MIHKLFAISLNCPCAITPLCAVFDAIVIYKRGELCPANI
jgi:hypothetical protein